MAIQNSSIYSWLTSVGPLNLHRKITDHRLLLNVARVVIPTVHGALKLYESMPNVSGYLPKIKGIAQKAGQAAGVTYRVALKGIGCLNEMVDFTNMGGTKDPQVSIRNSLERIKEQNDEFGDCCELLADQAAQVYLQHSKEIKQAIIDKMDAKDAFVGVWFNDISNWFTSIGQSFVGWFMNMSHNLIAQTIKANILHILANLTDQAFDPKHPFADSQRNPLGRLLTVVVFCLSEYEGRLEEIAKMPEDKREEQYQALFQQMSKALLAKFFPRGAADIQLFHHTLPFMGLLKEQLWSVLQGQLPLLLKRMYLETSSLEQKHPNWQIDFEKQVGVPQAQQLLKLPSTLFNQFIRSNRAKYLDSLEPVLEQWLHAQHVESAKHLSGVIVRYGRELLLTQDPVLSKMGAFFERYFMERLLFNFSHSVPEGDNTPLFEHLLEECVNKGLFEMAADALSGKAKVPGSYSYIISTLLVSFGLDRNETFPLPPLIKKMVWPFIKKQLQEDQLIDKIFKVIPRWPAFSRHEENRQQLNAGFQDPSFTQTLSSITESFVEPVIRLMSGLAVGEKINKALISHPLADAHREAINTQWRDLLGNNERKTSQALRDFVKQSLEALALQIGVNLFENYTKACTQAVEKIGTEKGPQSKPPSFAVWLMQEVNQVFQQLDLEGMSEVEFEALRKAIDLKNALRDTKRKFTIYLPEDEQEQAYQFQINCYTEQLDQLWPLIQPRYERVVRRLLEAFGYDHQRKLPLPETFNPMIWEVAITALPKVLFEQTGDLILPQLEKRQNQEQLNKLPKGPLIVEGCQLVVRDLMNQVLLRIDSYESIAQELNQKLLVGVLAPAQVVEFARSIQQLLTRGQLTVDNLFTAIEALLPPHEPFTPLQAEVLRKDLEVYKKRIYKIFKTPEQLVAMIPQVALTDGGVPVLGDSYEEVVRDINLNLLIEILDQERRTNLVQLIEQLITADHMNENDLYAAIEKVLPPHEPFSPLAERVLRKDLNVYWQRIKQIATVKVIRLTDQSKQSLTNQLRAFVHQEDAAFAPVWQWVESYIEGMLLKVAVSLNQMDQQTLQNLKDLVQETQQLLINPKAEDVPQILEEFVDELLELLGIEEKQAVFGVPSLLSDWLIVKGKKLIGQRLLGAYHLNDQIRHLKLVNPVEKEMPTSKLTQATLALTRFGLDKATTQLSHSVQGKMPMVDKISHPIQQCLAELELEGIQIAKLFKEHVVQQEFVPLLEYLFKLLNGQESQSYKQQMADWINPVLIEQVIRTFAPLLEKERKGKADFDQALIMGLLPIGIHHIKHLNQASQQPGGLTFDNYVKAADGKIHPAVPVKGDEKEKKQQRLKEFYQRQVDLILQLIFPNGKEDLKQVIQDLAPELVDPIWDLAKSQLTEQLPQVLDLLFNKESLTAIFTAMYAAGIESLDRPIKTTAARNQPRSLDPLAREATKNRPSVPLTPEERERERQMDQLVGEFVVEAARFIDLPVERLPGWVKRIVGWNNIERSTFEAIGAAMRKQFDGDFLTKNLQLVLSKLANQHPVKNNEPHPPAGVQPHMSNLEAGLSKLSNQKPVKKSERRPAAAPPDANDPLSELERKLVERGIAYAFRSVGAFLQRSTDVFDNAILKAVREGVIAVCSFVMMRIVASTLRFLRIERLVANRLYNVLHHSREKTFTAFSRSDLNEDPVYKAVDAFEKVLIEH